MKGRALFALMVVIPVIILSGSLLMLTSAVTPLVNATGSCSPPALAVGTPLAQSFGYGVTIVGTTVPGSPGTAGTACSITLVAISWGDGTSSTILFPHPATFKALHTYNSSGTYAIVVHSFQSDGKISTVIAAVRLT